MKNRNQLLILFIFIGTIFTLQAQPPAQATNTNYPIVAQEITANLGVNCYQTTTELTNYLAGILVGASSQCAIPDPTITQFAGSNVFFSWPNVQGAVVYRLFHLNLQTGISGYTDFPPSATQSYKLTDIDDGLYLFAVQASCSTSKSFFGIIIAEKDLMSAYNPHLTCRCDAYSGSQILVNNNYTLPPSSVLDLFIPLEEAENEIQIRVKTGLAGQVVQFNPDCGDLNFQFGIGWPSYPYLGSIAFFNGTVIYDFDPNLQMIMQVCAQKSPASTTYPAPPKISPNPVSSSFNLEMISSADLLQVQLLDLQGRLIKSWTQNTYEGFLQTEFVLPPTLSPGMYLIRVQNGEQANTLKLQKI
ncbi:MAG: T9SS type A sorting domain-containing protein [Saprospiraceae bacterium]|nr:T9SS type A sorting domain-containing protein [Saprospiraceae bacterium]